MRKRNDKGQYIADEHIIIECAQCGEKREIIKCIAHYAKFCSLRCKGISHSGAKSKKWKGGLPICVDCGAVLGGYLSKRCKPCSYIFRCGKNSGKWKGGISLHPKYYSRRCKVRRAKKMKLSMHFTVKEFEILKKKYDHMCLSCKRFEPEIKLTSDHVVPLSRGGADTINNIQPLCQVCNSKKYTKIIDFRESFKRNHFYPHPYQHVQNGV